MKNSLLLFFALILILPVSGIHAQSKQHDKANYVVPKSPFYENMQEEIAAFNRKSRPERKSFKLDFTGMDLPKSTTEFTQSWHFKPINQGMTGTCWSFSTTSFFESEIYRLSKKEVKLSEMYSAYFEYIEKARRFVSERGDSEFGEGSESNAIQRIWKKYGIVPEEVYNGMLPGQKHHDHSKMFAEMAGYLNGLKASNDWNEEVVVSTIKSILNHYMGEPPAKFTYQGKEMTPQEFLKNVTGLKMDDYIDFTSFMEFPYYTKCEYKVPDNWWHDSSYYNLPLDVYMSTLKQAIRKGYTVAIGGDVTEAGIDAKAEVAMVPSFDIPSEYIDENARQFRFDNQTTTDDHGIHLVGYMEKNGKDWYLIKDSGAGIQSSANPGYYFYHEDYVKLKMTGFMVHKDAASEILKQFAHK